MRNSKRHGSREGPGSQSQIIRHSGRADAAWPSGSPSVSAALLRGPSTFLQWAACAAHCLMKAGAWRQQSLRLRCPMGLPVRPRWNRRRASIAKMQHEFVLEQCWSG